MSDWMQYFEKRCINSKLMGTALEKVFLGKIYQLNGFYYNGNDGLSCSPKISTLFFADSGDGKDTARYALEDAINRYNNEVEIKNKQSPDKFKPIKYAAPTNTNVAGLIGTIRFQNGTPIEEYGLLHDCNLIYLPECQTIFYTTEHKSTMLETLQRALDERGEINVQYAGSHSLIYPTKASIIMHSTKFGSISRVILEKGLVQRGLFFDSSKTMEESKDVLRNSIKSIAEGNKNFDEELRYYISKVMKSLENSNKQVTFDLTASNNFAIEYEKLIDDVAEKLDDDQQRVLKTFIVRYSNLAHKVACINCLFNYRNLVVKEDFDCAFDIVSSCLRAAAVEIKLSNISFEHGKQGRPKITINDIKVKELADKYKNEKREQLYSALTMEFGISRMKAYNECVRLGV